MSNFEEIFKDIPWGMNSLIPLESNPSIHIYKGVFQLKSNEDLVALTGEIGFQWYPHAGVFFSSQSNTYLLLKPRYDLVVNGNNVGSILIGSMGNPITGITRLEAVFGDTSKTVPKVGFTLLNTIEIPGDSIRWPSNGVSLAKGRIALKSRDFSIILDQVDIVSMIHSESCPFLIYRLFITNFFLMGAVAWLLNVNTYTPSANSLV